MSVRRRRKQSGRRFLRLWTNCKRSQAYHSLGAYARCALFELLERYTGINNGMIVCGVREMADALNCSRDTAARALHELDDSGLVRPTKLGRWRGRRATEWRLMFYRCDLSGDLPELNWPERVASDPADASGPSTVRSTATSVRQEGHKHNSRQSGRTRSAKNPKNGSGVSPTGATHVDVHHQDGARTHTRVRLKRAGDGDGTGDGDGARVGGRDR